MAGTISNSVIKRLPRYYRFLGELKKEGMTRISSRELSERMQLTASQIIIIRLNKPMILNRTI